MVTQVQLTSKFLRPDYVVEVLMQSYNNPTNRAEGQGGDCCDSNLVGSDSACTGFMLCDSYFIFCLRPLHTSPTQRGCDTPNITSEVASNNASIDFTQTTFLGIANPFHLNASGSWQVRVFLQSHSTTDTHDTHQQGIQLYVEVKDRDYTTIFNDTVQDDLIDVFAIDIVSTYAVAMSQGTYGYGTVSVTTSVQCAESYHGDQCQFVNKCERDNIECSGRGVCNAVMDTYVCICDLGYIGVFCERNDYCFWQNCSMRGACQNEQSSYHCICDPGFTDSDCEIYINECEGQNCSGNGQCVDGESKFICTCYHGFTGKLCNIVFQAEGKLILDTNMLIYINFLWTR